MRIELSKDELVLLLYLVAPYLKGAEHIEELQKLTTKLEKELREAEG